MRQAQLSGKGMGGGRRKRETGNGKRETGNVEREIGMSEVMR